MPVWHLDVLNNLVEADFLSKFEVREKFQLLSGLRARLKETYEENGVLDVVTNKNYQSTKLHFIVPSVDSEEASLLELLEDDLNDFFFGVPIIVIETEEQNKRITTAPIKTLKHSVIR